MKADETELKTLLEGVKQFCAPTYQRRYVWKRPELQQLWTQVRRQYDALLVANETGDEVGRATHFLGSFVLSPHTPQAVGVTQFDIVDGQQRLTTLLIFLSAIRDLYADELDKDRLNNTYLRNAYREGPDRLKLTLTEADAPQLEAILDGNASTADGLVGSAYVFLRNKIEVAVAATESLDLAVLEETLLSRLAIVAITAELGDNVHRIFQTLNSSGVMLAPVDLLRNHFFMLLPNQGDAVFVDLWRPMEDLLGTGGVDDFFLTELLRREGHHERFARKDVYPFFRTRLEEIESDEDSVVEMLATLRKRADVFAWIRSPSLCGREVIERRLLRLLEWGTATADPLVLEILLRVDCGEIDEADADTALLYLESYLVRRLLLRIPTNNLNRIMSEVPGGLGPGPVSDALRTALSGGGRYWPTDEEIKARITTEEFYKAQRPAQRQFVLRRLEEALPHEVQPDWEAANLTIEHVMPQTLTEEWYLSLDDLEQQKEDPAARESAPDLHARLVHTIGNLTLSAWNPELGAKLFDEKRETLYERGPLELNRQIIAHSQWGGEEIRQRSRDLGELALTLWPGPAPDAAGAGFVDNWDSVVQALASLPAGRWTTYAELAEIADRPVPDVMERLRDGPPGPGVERVMLSTGGIDVTATWAHDDLARYKSRLIAEGVLESVDDSVAASDGLMTADELSALVDEGP